MSLVLVLRVLCYLNQKVTKTIKKLRNSLVCSSQLFIHSTVNKLQSRTNFKFVSNTVIVNLGRLFCWQRVAVILKDFFLYFLAHIVNFSSNEMQTYRMSATTSECKADLKHYDVYWNRHCFFFFKRLVFFYFERHQRETSTTARHCSCLKTLFLNESGIRVTVYIIITITTIVTIIIISCNFVAKRER